MVDRQYTVGEIVRMRAAIEYQLVNSPMAFTPAVVEDQLRTYMGNATEPDELDGAVQQMVQDRVILVPEGTDTSPGGVTRVG